MTRHAQTRARQRGIRTRTLDLLMQFGTLVHDHRGGCLVVFDNAARSRVANALGKAAAQLKLDAYMVLDASLSVVVTTGHRTRRIREGA